MANEIENHLLYFKAGFQEGTRTTAKAKKACLDEAGMRDYEAGRVAGMKALEEAASEYQTHLVAEAGWPPVEGQRYRHCDDYIHDLNQPVCLRIWLLRQRVPAVDGMLMDSAGIKPKLFATWMKPDGEMIHVRLVMASRFGDVGITTHLFVEQGYQHRVPLEHLSKFREKP